MLDDTDEELRARIGIAKAEAECRATPQWTLNQLCAFIRSRSEWRPERCEWVLTDNQMANLASDYWSARRGR